MALRSLKDVEDAPGGRSSLKLVLLLSDSTEKGFRSGGLEVKRPHGFNPPGEATSNLTL